MKNHFKILLREIINNPSLREKVANSPRLTDQNLINDPLLFDKNFNTPLLSAASVNTPELFNINLRLDPFNNYAKSLREILNLSDSRFSISQTKSLREILNLSDSRFTISQKIRITDNIASSMKGYAFIRDDEYVEGPYFLQPYVATTPPGNSREF